MVLATVKRDVSFWPFLSASMGTLNTIFGTILLRTDSNLVTWITNHPTVAIIGFCAWAIAPLAYGGLSLFQPLLSRRYVLPGTSGPKDMTEHLKKALNILSEMSNDRNNAKLRVTLFVPDESNKELYQLARYDWLGRAVE